MIFIYGENDPWTAAGVTWAQREKDIHVFIQPAAAIWHASPHCPKRRKEEVMKLLNEWLR